MSFVKSVWKLLVAIKDGLVLALLFLFFAALSTALTARSGPGAVRGGALYLALDGAVVEEKSRLDPAALLLSGEAPQREYLARDVTLAVEQAASDDRIKAVALELDGFGGGRQVLLERLGAALDKVRAAKKPVLVHATLYQDGAYLLAAHASEIWVDPLGAVALSGPGGTALFYKGLLDRLKVEAHVFRVGTFKSAVEPYLLTGFSDEARTANTALYGALKDNWQADIARARPAAQVTQVIGQPVEWLAAAGNDPAKAALAARLVDKVGDRTQFGDAVARIVGPPKDEKDHLPGTFQTTSIASLLADHPLPTKGRAIAVATVAGEIVDGGAGPGTAGGDRIAGLIDAATGDENVAALVLRVDSPGGSVMASERIRAAVARFRASKRPVAVSMGGVAASGGYWVATPAQRIFAEPATITGSIGVFAVLPTFDKALANWGVTPDSIRTGPLSGQPDLAGGLTPQSEAVLQAGVGQIYANFLSLVAASRKTTPEAVDRVAQGRVWDGGTARQLGLVDQFGGLDDAVGWVAQEAKLADGGWHVRHLGAGEGRLERLLQQVTAQAATGSGNRASAPRDLAGAMAASLADTQARVAHDLTALVSGRGVQALCLPCTALDGAPPPAPEKPGAMARLLGWLALK